MILSLRLVKIFETFQASISTEEFFLIILLLLPSIHFIILPISYLIATTITLTKLSSTNELIALNNSCISSMRVLKVLFIITLPIFFFNLLNSIFIKPASNKFLREITESKFQNIIATPQKNVFTRLSKGKYIYLEGESKKGDGIIYASFKDDNFIAVSALTGEIEKEIVNFKFGNLIMSKADKTEILDFETLSLPINLDTEKKSEDLKRGYLPFLELLKRYKENPNNRVIKTEIFYRIFYSFAPLILLILSFPLSIGFSRHYKTQGIIVSVSVGLLFYILFSSFDTMSIKGAIEPYIGFPLIYTFLILIAYIAFLKKGIIIKKR